MSPPARRRGLKLSRPLTVALSLLSPPARRRGLKHNSCSWHSGIRYVASRAEAWIETEPLPVFLENIFVASRAEAWIETRN